MHTQELLQRTLRERLEELKLKNSSYSLRSFAKLLDISPASLSEFLNGKRLLSTKMSNKIVSRLNLSPNEINAVTQSDENDRKGEVRSRLQLADDQYFLIADWHYYAILGLLKTKGFNRDYEWMAKRLNTSPLKISKCFERLIRLGLLKYNKVGDLEYKDITLDTSDDIARTSIQRRHVETLEKAHNALFEVDVKDRDFSSLTLAIDKSKIPSLKKLIHKFQDEVEALCQDGEKDEVYEIALQMFPITNLDKKRLL